MTAQAMSLIILMIILTAGFFMFIIPTLPTGKTRKPGKQHGTELGN